MNIADFCDRLVDIAFDPTPAKITRLLLTTFMSLVIEEQKGIDKKLDTLIGSYYKDGLAHLENARGTSDEERKKKSIEAASEKFITASNVESPLLAAKARFFAAVCYDLLAEKELALKWYEDAYVASQAI